MSDEEFELEPVTRITLGHVYKAVLLLKDELSGLPARVNDHEVRIRAIEKYLWVWIGAAGVGGAGLGQIINATINS